MTQTIIQASALIFVVLVLRLLLRGKMRQRTLYLMWLPVLARLALPVSVFHLPSRVSLMNPVRTAVQRAPESLQPLINNISTGQVYVTDAVNAPAPVRAASVDWQLVGMVVWIAGAVLILGWIVMVNLRFARRLRRDRVRVSECAGLTVYTVTGLGSPCLAMAGGQLGIYVSPEIAADPARFRHVLAHEIAHFRQHDHIWAVWRVGLTALYWWNPLVWLAAALSRQDSELACDEAALEALGEDERLAYGRTLVGLVSRRTAPRDLVRAATSMSAGGRALRERIRRIAKQPRTSAAAVLLAVCVLGFGIAAAFTSAVELPKATAWNSSFPNAVSYAPPAGNLQKPSATASDLQLSLTKSSLTRQEIAQEWFTLYSANIFQSWAADGYPLDEIVLFDVNIENPDVIAAADESLYFTPVYAVKPQSDPFLSSAKISVIRGFERGYGALEGYLLTSTSITLTNEGANIWSIAKPSYGTSISAGMRLNLDEDSAIETLCQLGDETGYFPLLIELHWDKGIAGLCDLVEQKGDDLRFEDFSDYQGIDLKSRYFQEYDFPMLRCSLYFARANLTDPPLYMVLINHATGKSVDIREGRRAIEAVARGAGGNSADVNAAMDVVEAFIAEHPVWQDATLRYDADQDVKERARFLQNSGGAEDGYTEDNVIVLLCDFTAGEGPVLEIGQRYTDYNFILARRSAADPWEIVDLGY